MQDQATRQRLIFNIEEQRQNIVRNFNFNFSIYLFAIENYMWIEAKKKQKNYLVSHGEEAQKKLAGL